MPSVTTPLLAGIGIQIQEDSGESKPFFLIGMSWMLVKGDNIRFYSQNQLIHFTAWLLSTQPNDGYTSLLKLQNLNKTHYHIMDQFYDNNNVVFWENLQSANLQN